MVVEKKYGGIAGHMGYLPNAGNIVVDNCDIIGLTQNSNQVGGVVGYFNIAYNYRYISYNNTRYIFSKLGNKARKFKRNKRKG